MTDPFAAAFDRLVAVHSLDCRPRPCRICGLSSLLGVFGLCDDCDRKRRWWQWR